MAADDLTSATGELERLRAEVARLSEDLSASQQREAALQSQVTATADVLRVVASRPADAFDVLQAIVDSVAGLCPTAGVSFFRVVGDEYERMANSQHAPSGLPVGSRGALTRESSVGRAVIEKRTLRHDDVDAIVDREYPDTARGYRARLARQGPSGLPNRSLLVVPLLGKDDAIGALVVARTEVDPFTDDEVALFESMAAQAVIAIENARLFSELQDRTTDLTQALERQTAVGEVLRVIASSPTDAQPVLETIARSAMHLSDSIQALLLVRDGEYLVKGAGVGEGAAIQPIGGPIPLTARRDTVAAFQQRRTIHTPDRSDPAHLAAFPDIRNHAPVATVVVPLVHDQEAIGILSVGRRVARGYSPAEIALVETFADQAAIAIANARLFQDLQESNRQVTEALEQQTATSEVLRVIASTPTDLQAVTDALAENAARLCESDHVVVQRLDGDVFRALSVYGPLPGVTADVVVQVRPGTVAGRAVIERRTIHIHDRLAEIDGWIAASPTDEPRLVTARANNAQSGVRTALATPILKHDEPIGAIVIFRREVKPFTDQQIRLLETFADQAGIAIENTRLFEELERRNRELTESLERQTATSEILRAIADAPANLDVVFETVARSASRVCGADDATIHLVEDDQVGIASHYGPITSRWPGSSERSPIRRGTVVGRTLMDRRTLHILDLAAMPADEWAEGLEIQRRTGQRTTLATPLLRQGEAIGTIMIRRLHVEAFTEAQIVTLEAFAAQAVIAIENARLFAELQESNRRVTEALEQQTATAEVLRVVASRPTDATAVLQAIADTAARLCQVDNVGIDRVVGNETERMANYLRGNRPLGVGTRRALIREAWQGRAILERRTIIHDDFDAIVDREYPAQARLYRQVLRERGAENNPIRSMIVLPLLRENEAIGALNVIRYAHRPFTDAEIALLETFADQAVIAIENARLFEELERRNRELSEAWSARPPPARSCAPSPTPRRTSTPCSTPSPGTRPESAARTTPSSTGWSNGQQRLVAHHGPIETVVQT